MKLKSSETWSTSGDHRIGTHAIGVTDQSDHHGHLFVPSQRTTDQIGAALAKEGRLDQLDGMRALDAAFTHALAQRARDRTDATADVGIAVGERVVGQMRLQTAVSPSLTE
ncbi:MAG: hypothetical protein R3F00_01640 [Dokdonella sp.]